MRASAIGLTATLTGAEPVRVIDRALETARDMLDMDIAYVADVRSGLHECVAITGDAGSFGARLDAPVPLEGTYCELLLRGHLDGIVRNAREHPLTGDLPATEAARIGSYIGVPVTLPDGRTFGTFCCVSHNIDPSLHQRDLRFMTILGRLIGDQLAREEEHARDRHDAVATSQVGALMAALEARDGYTGEHSEEVVALSLAIAERLSVDEAELGDVETAARLHDIGKIGISDAILRKPSRLDETEWAEMERHPEIGERIVASMPGLAHLARVVRAEHERWDGRGYPDGLRGEVIPLISRILLVSDAWHAMTSDRPYRSAMGRDTALQELRRGAGSQFCPSAASAALVVLEPRPHLH
jgi:HD-GYP domain-containing protein (c-di-GMP phosphodiesterase class II)